MTILIRLSEAATCQVKLVLVYFDHHVHNDDVQQILGIGHYI